jgi:hypothetical protein
MLMRLRRIFGSKSHWLIPVSALMLAAGCSNTPTSPKPPDTPAGPPPPVTSLIGNLFFHDLGPDGLRDIFMADLFLVPKSAASEANSGIRVRLVEVERGRGRLRPGVLRLRRVEIDGQVKEKAVANITSGLAEIDISEYEFVLKNLENLGEPGSDDSAVDVSSLNWIVYVKDPGGPAIDRYDSQIVYMSLDDRVRHQLTPINGQYDGRNADPQWKGDRVVSWVYNGRIVEADLDRLDGVTNVLADWNWPQYDPVYSPDGKRLLFNTWVEGKKNSFVKHLESGTYMPCLPQQYFERHTDDNPTWVFSNDKIVGHIFWAKKGRVYTRNLESGEFAIITDTQHDFRYVTPVLVRDAVYFIFADFEKPGRPKLWVSDEMGSDLRELAQNGNEAVFVLLGLPIPQDEQDLEGAAAAYVRKFSD